MMVYTRRWERWLAVVWPPKRKRLRMMNRLAEMSMSEILEEHNRAMRDLLLYGVSYSKVRWDHTRPKDADSPSP